MTVRAKQLQVSNLLSNLSPFTWSNSNDILFPFHLSNPQASHDGFFKPAAMSLLFGIFASNHLVVLVTSITRWRDTLSSSSRDARESKRLAFCRGR